MTLPELQHVHNIKAAFELLEEELKKLCIERSKRIRCAIYEALEKRSFECASALIKQLQSDDQALREVELIRETWAKSNLETGRPCPPLQRTSPIYVTMTYDGIRASGVYESGRVVLQRGSQINNKTFDSLGNREKALRAWLLSTEVLIEDEPGRLVLQSDQSFRSPSAAAQFVAGCSVSGNREWRLVETGETLGDWRARIEEKTPQLHSGTSCGEASEGFAQDPRGLLQ